MNVPKLIVAVVCIGALTGFVSLTSWAVTPLLVLVVVLERVGFFKNGPPPAAPTVAAPPKPHRSFRMSW